MEEKVAISTLVVQSGCMFRGPGDNQDEAYVLTVVDSSKSLYQGVRAFDKKPITWNPTDMVTPIPIPGAGAELLAL